MLFERLADTRGQTRHVLIVVDDRNQLAMLVRTSRRPGPSASRSLLSRSRAARRARCPCDCPESIVLQTECVCKTAPAPRRLAISTCRSVSADGLPRRRPDDAAALVALEDVRRAQGPLRQRAGRDREAQRPPRHDRAEIAARPQRPPARVERAADRRKRRGRFRKRLIASHRAFPHRPYPPHPPPDLPDPSISERDARALLPSA